MDRIAMDRAIQVVQRMLDWRREHGTPDGRDFYGENSHEDWIRADTYNKAKIECMENIIEELIKVQLEQEGPE